MRAGAASLLFALVHSLFSSDGAKNGARALLGERRGTAFYRAFFMLQSTLTLVATTLFIMKQPHRMLYEARGWKRFYGWSAQALGLAIAFAGASQLDLGKFLGTRGIVALQNGETLIPEAQAQGPEIEDDGQIRVTGPFRFSRHAIEWAVPVVLFSSPKMKTSWLVFDAIMTLYCYLGALHEEKRLGNQSPHYAKYQEKVPFFLAWPKK